MQKPGFIIFWTDYVRIFRDEDGETRYSQSDKPRRGYHPRTIAMTRGPGQDIYISAAAAFQNNLSKKATRDLAYGRMMQVLREEGVPAVETRGFTLPRWGMTVLPREYLDLVLYDHHCYANLYGPPNPRTFWEKVADIYAGHSHRRPERGAHRN